MAFWALALAISIVTLAAMLVPMLRRSQDLRARAAYDLDVYKDQLAALDSDLERGVITAEEADQTRIELSRRVLAADAALASSEQSGMAPRAATSFALAGAFGAILASLGLYFYLGSPDLDDAPLAPRLEEARAMAEANRPTQDFAEAMTATRMPAPEIDPQDAALLGQLESVLASRPDDVQGQRLLARSYMQVGRHIEGRQIQQRLVGQLGPEVTAEDLSALAEYMVVAAGGYVSPDAEDVLDRVLQRDPADWFARYYKSRAFVQNGQTDAAVELLNGLAADASTPPALAAAVREDLATLRPGFGPTADDIAAAEAMSAEDRAAMIASMVDGLDARLAEEGGDAEEWIRLIRARLQLGEATQAQAALARARAALVDAPAALDAVEQFAAEVGL